MEGAVAGRLMLIVLTVFLVMDTSCWTSSVDLVSSFTTIETAVAIGVLGATLATVEFNMRELRQLSTI